jgi:hypothetical protein
VVRYHPEHFNRIIQSYKGPDKRAYELFRSLLTEAQRTEMDTEQYVTVIGSHGGEWRLYVIETVNNCMRIYKSHLPGRKPRFRKWCAALPVLPYPIFDTHIAQLLAIQTDERRFTRIAFGSLTYTLDAAD